MNVFLDTEFTDLLEPQLISLGLVADSGLSCYVELLGWQRGQCSDFVREVVIPLLDAPRRVSVHGASAEILRFFKDLGPFDLMCDSATDLQLLGELLYDGAHPTPPNLNGCFVVTLPVQAEMMRERAYEQGLRRHHALDDALALREGWRYV